MRTLAIVALLVTLPAGLPAQAAGPGSVAIADSTQHRPGPMNYFWRSALLPGWGQASLDRKLTAGLFIGFEGLALSMALKASVELKYLDRTDTATATSRRGERQDWIVLLAFNHLFAAMEAYVSAHLIDFPGDLRIRVLPGGRTGFGMTMPLPH
ncbi:MAG TPA: hypothetical protein VGL65_08550 [Gemmatimonadales bacterium]|jgi:hypothetical protein